MDYRDKIIMKLAAKEVDRLARIVVSRLRRSHESLMSGEDSGLKNIWDEYCVQTQSEKSFFYSSYEDVIKEMIRTELTRVPNELRAAIWLQTEEGMDWYEMNSETDAEQTSDSDDIVDHVYESVEEKSLNYTNSRIEKYIYRSDESKNSTFSRRCPTRSHSTYGGDQ